MCAYKGISSGSDPIGCDNNSALHLAFEEEANISLITLDFDLLYAIRNNVQSSPIDWVPIHVKGHQDNNTKIIELPQLAILNCKMDALAKHTLAHVLESPAFQADC